MNTLERWFLKRLLRKEFKQGYSHLKNLRNIFWIIRRTWEEEFTEDSWATTDNVLRYEFERTQVQPLIEKAIGDT